MTTAAPRKPASPQPPTGDHAVTAYARAVVAGEIVAGKLVKLACVRHLRDLETGSERGLFFDTAAADLAVKFFALLRLVDGANAGQSFNLEPWQVFNVGSIFGWKRADGLRRFRYGLIEVARSNGKTPMFAGIGLYGLVMDGQQGAQIYSAATTREQAKIMWGDGAKMAMASPSIAKRLTRTVNNLAYVAQGSYFRPLAAEANTMDGLRVHMGLVDELHEHPNGEVMAKLRTGMKTAQPLLLAITTAGYDRHSVCWEEHEYAIKVLEGVLDNDAYYGFIASLDEGDDWMDEAVWPKANPNLGVSVQLDLLREECAMARETPGKQNSFKRLRLNLWTEQASRWIDMDRYDENDVHPIDLEELRGRSSIPGLDLATTTDICALVHLIPCPHQAGAFDVVPRFWVPEEAIERRSKRDRVPYDVWADAGLLLTTPGNVVDYEYIRTQIGQDAALFAIKELGYDPWNAQALATGLMQDGLTVVPIRQGFASLSAPTKELEKLILGKKFHHGGHKVLRWMFSNVAVTQDSAGNLKPAKDKSTERIDGVAATVTGLARVIVAPGEEEAWAFGAM